MTTRLPTREQVVSILEQVRAEPEGPDQATAIERLEAQLAGLDEPESDVLTGPDADLVEAPLDGGAAPVAKPAPAPAAPAPPGKPFGKPAAEPGKPADDKADKKPF